MRPKIGKKIFYTLLIFAAAAFTYSCSGNNKISLKKEFTKNLIILCDDLINLQNKNTDDMNYGSLFCRSCKDNHTRASEAVLPFAVAYKETKNEKYFTAAVSTGEWLIAQQKQDGSWFETPSEWTGTTTDQLLMMAASYPVLKDKFTAEQREKWKSSIKGAAEWLVKNMNHEFASINYCATTTASLMIAFEVVHDSAFVKKADELARLVTSKFDEDYFLTGEGNRIINTKYGIDLGYNMDMSLWGLGIYSRLAKNKTVEYYVKESLKRVLYFIYPDGSVDNSWGVRSSKWTTYGSFTADGSQILFSLFATENPAYRSAALANMNYFMSMKVNGLLTYGPHYYRIFNSDPCIYPTFCRAKNLAMAVLFGEQNESESAEFPSKQKPWSKYFKTIDVALIRTENFMATVTAYRYKDIRRGADFKYMHRPSGGSITNLWVENYGYLQASGQTEYKQWEFNYPVVDKAVSITPRIEFTDSTVNGEKKYYTNLYDFDSHLELSGENGIYKAESIGELKDRNRWEGGVAYTLTHFIGKDYLEKNINLRFHGRKQPVSIIEPFIQNKNTEFKFIDSHTVQILGGKREFVFELLTEDCRIEAGTDAGNYSQPFPSLKGFPIVIKAEPLNDSFIKEVRYRIEIK